MWRDDSEVYLLVGAPGGHREVNGFNVTLFNDWLLPWKHQLVAVLHSVQCSVNTRGRCCTSHQLLHMSRLRYAVIYNMQFFINHERQDINVFIDTIR